MNIPPIFKSLKFYEALSYLAGGIVILLVLFGKLDPSQAWTPAAILTWILGILRLFGIVPELRAKGLTK